MVWLFLFAAFGAVLVALGQIFYLKNSKNRVAFFMYLSMAYILVYFKMAFDLTMVDYGHLYLTGNIAGIAAGCLIYYHVRSVSDEGFVFGWRHGLIIVGCIAAYALPLCPFWVLDGRQKGELLRKMITSGYLYWDEPQLAGISVFKLSNTVFAINSVAFIGLATLRLVRSIDGGRVWRNFYFYLSLIIGIGFIATLIGSYGAWVGSVFLIELLGGVLGACIFGFYLVGQAFPWALYERKLEQEAAEPTASRTRLKDEDRVRIAAKLDILLNQERLYRRSDLTLSALAVAVALFVMMQPFWPTILDDVPNRVMASQKTGRRRPARQRLRVGEGAFAVTEIIVRGKIVASRRLEFAIPAQSAKLFEFPLPAVVERHDTLRGDSCG